MGQRAQALQLTHKAQQGLKEANKAEKHRNTKFVLRLFMPCVMCVQAAQVIQQYGVRNNL